MMNPVTRERMIIWNSAWFGFDTACVLWRATTHEWAWCSLFVVTALISAFGLWHAWTS